MRSVPVELTIEIMRLSIHGRCVTPLAWASVNKAYRAFVFTEASLWTKDYVDPLIEVRTKYSYTFEAADCKLRA